MQWKLGQNRVCCLDALFVLFRLIVSKDLSEERRFFAGQHLRRGRGGGRWLGGLSLCCFDFFGRHFVPNSTRSQFPSSADFTQNFNALVSTCEMDLDGSSSEEEQVKAKGLSRKVVSLPGF